MDDRWRGVLNEINLAEPDVEKLRQATLERRRFAGPPPVGPARRVATAVFALAVAAAGVGLAVLAIPDAADERIGGEPASTTLVPSGGSYRLSGFAVEITSIEEPAAGAGSDRGEQRFAMVSFRTRWTSPTFPGEADCIVRLMDADDQVVQTYEFGYATFSPDEHTGRHRIGVELSDGQMPVTADASCGPGMLFDGSSEYVFSDLEVAGDRLKADIAWSAGTPVGDAACGIRVTTPNGGRAIDLVHLSVGPGVGGTVALLSRTYPEGSRAEIRCEPYRVPQQMEQRYWVPWRGGSRQLPSIDSQAITSVDPAALRDRLDRLGWPAYVDDEEAHVAEWATEFGIDGMPPDSLVSTIDRLRSAVRDQRGADAWLAIRELSVRMHYACVRLPADHPYRGGELCD